MEYARAKKADTLIHVREGIRGTRYVCPTCGLPVELRRGQDLEYFAHWRGLEGTRECELFVPGVGAGSRSGSVSPRPDNRVEDDPSELGLILDQFDGEWSLGLRIPEIAKDELGDMSLAELRPAHVQVTSGIKMLGRVSALDLRPGVGAARIPVPPTLQEYRARPAGSWPRQIDSAGWDLECSGLAATGALFRLRRGEWTRLFANSGLHHGERLLVFADTRCSPPQEIVREVHAQLSSGGLHWTIWEIEIPNDVAAGAVAAWLARTGHSLVRRPWDVTLVTPARTYGESGEPVFWLDDLPLLELEAPMPAAEALATVTSGTNRHMAQIRSANDGTVRVLLDSRSPGLTHFRLTADRSVGLDCTFSERPSQSTVCELLVRTPRLRVWMGDECFEPWPDARHTVRLRARESPDLRVELGGDTERARVTVWERGKQRCYPGLSGREVANTLERALVTASLIEIDADNQGRIDLIPSVVATAARGKTATHDRLAWQAHVQGIVVRPGQLTIPTMLKHPRTASRLVARSVGIPALVRTRLALRRRGGTGTRPS